MHCLQSIETKELSAPLYNDRGDCLKPSQEIKRSEVTDAKKR